MEEQNSRQESQPRRKQWIIALLVLLIAAAAIAAFLYARGSRRGSLTGRPVPEPSGDFATLSSNPTSGAVTPRPGDVVIEIAPDKLANAQIKIEAAVEPSGFSAMTGGLRATGTVQANAYKETPVLPIAGGVAREVNAQLGDRVKRGQKLAVIFSAELADAQADFLRMQAGLEKHHHRYKRTADLAEIGAASRQELEEATADYKTEQAKLSAMRQKLALLGLSAQQMNELERDGQVSALITVESPASGTILSRTVNIGEVVMSGKELFRVADLSTVWVIGQIYEKDFATTRVGTPAAITTPAYPDKKFTGRVSFIDPRVDPQTRTAQVRVEVANPGEMLKLGMFVDVSFGNQPAASSSGQPVAAAPRAALQYIGGKQVVYLATDKAGSFVQREVNAGTEANGLIPVYNGLAAGDRLVTEGSFLLRAESLKLNPAQLTAATPPPGQPQSQSVSGAQQPIGAQKTEPASQAVSVTLTEKGYQPDSIRLRSHVPARLTFTRKVEQGCGTEVVIPDYGIRRELPFNTPVVIEFTPGKAGEFKFACGMDMLRGKLIVR
ncbi:MAG: efflux RND transporter periplasmic adaptor subunit [Blastocatellia bacterium]